jgi:hypothetical protein
MMQKKISLVLVSFLGLFLELSIIRWFPAHIFSIAFFSNTVLIASFLGIGLGLLVSNHKRDLFNFFTFILVGSIFIVLFLKNIQLILPVDAQTWIWSYYQGNRLYATSNLRIPILYLIGFVFVLVVIIFIPIGQKIGKLMKEFPPLFAYVLNILGSLLGVICFGILAIFSTPAYIWFAIAGLTVIFINYRKRGFIIDCLLILIIVFFIRFLERNILWSPYYAIESRKTEEGSISVFVNQLFHQKAVNFEREPEVYKKYLLPYELFKPKRVLIIGAGTGNDVWVARTAGVDYIEAVEIDPVILKLGYTLHPQQPYHSDRVKIFVDDARSFMHHTNQKYDMIVYGTLDSHAALSVSSSIRLDNYIYTKDALREAKNLLNQKGTIALLFSVPNDWLMARLMETVRSVFGTEECRYILTDNYLFNLMILAGPGIKYALEEKPDLSNLLLPLPTKLNVVVPTDNWPYLYLMKRNIPNLYLGTLTLLIILSIGLIFVLSPWQKGKIDLLFFLLGCGFLLLETKSVTTFSLLFGSTWIVNAIVFSAILAIALLATWFVMAKHLENSLVFFAMLIICLILIYFFPIAGLLKLSFLTKILATAILVALPILFSSLIFAIHFKNTKNSGISLGSNLLGAVIGGFIEYTSMIWGLNTLYLIALGFYSAAAFYSLKK